MLPATPKLRRISTVKMGTFTCANATIHSPPQRMVDAISCSSPTAKPGLSTRLTTGSPILAEEHIETHYRLDPHLFNPKPHYLLRVHGMSMKDAGILDGDLVAVHRTPEVRSRQIVVARLDDEVTVKRYRQNGSKVELLPENDEFEPIQVDLAEQAMVIEGVVVGVIRDGVPSH